MGKTVVTAAVAALASTRGEKVAVVKPAQTGVAAGEPGDLDEVRRLPGIGDAHELARFPDPLSPEAAARASGLPPPDLARAAADVRSLAATRDRVLVEGAGGLLVRYRPDVTTLADLAGEPMAGVLPAGRLGPAAFRRTAAEGLGPSLGGHFDPAGFREKHAAAREAT